MSDALQHPPSFDEMVGIIEKLFKDSLEMTKLFTDAEIESGWQRYKALNHLWQEEVPHIHKDTVEENWESFWKSIVTNEDGTISIEQVKKELHDFSFIMEQVPKVYCHITGNRMSKVMYHADTVISVADDYFQEQLEAAIKVEAEPGDESGTAAPEWDSIRLIGRVKERFKELEEKQHDWRSFYCAWLEGRVDMLQQIKGCGRLSQECADFIREANNRDLEGTVAGREEDAEKAQFDNWHSWLSSNGYTYDGEFYYDEDLNYYTPDQLWGIFK